MITTPLLSIIVPTLNRARTLKETLRTIAAQNFADLEIIVSDNYSSDDTQKVVSEAGLAKLRYINPGRRLSMSTHYEFAVGHATGRYVALLGDDDGIVKDGLARTAELLEANGYPDALGGINIEYHWPDSPIAFHESICRIPVERWIEQRDSRENLRLLKTNTRNYTHLPMIYRAFVSRELLNRIKSKTQRLFRSCIPDVYASIAIAASIESYVFTSEPLFIEGVSGDSNGARTLAAEDSAADEAFFSNDCIPFHTEIPYAPSIPFITAETLLQARDAGLLQSDDIMSPTDLLTRAAMESVGMLPMRYNQVWSAITELASRLDMKPLALDLRERFLNQPCGSDPFSKEALSLVVRPPEDQLLQLRMDQFGCENVYDCMILTAPFVARLGTSAGIASAIVKKVSKLEAALQQQIPSPTPSQDQALQLAETNSKLLVATEKLAQSKKLLTSYKTDLKQIRTSFKKAIEKLYGSRSWKWSSFFAHPFKRRMNRTFTPLDRAFEELSQLSSPSQTKETKVDNT